MTSLIAAVAVATPAPLIRGWMIHRNDPSYHEQVLAAAKRYRINHLELAGSHPTYSDEMALGGESVARAAARARVQGIDALIWVRELNTREANLSLDPADPKGQAFWAQRKGALRRALDRAPDLAGIVLSLASTPTEVWDVQDPSPFWQSKKMPERVRFVVEQFRNVAVSERGKRMFVRDFNHGPEELDALVQGLKDLPGIIVHSKWEPQDWQPFYPHSRALGAVGRTPQVIEADLGAEYWGRSMVPVSLVRHIKRRWEYGRSKGAIGVVARVDRDSETALGTPSEINLYALTRYLDDARISPEKVYREWGFVRYGLPPGSSASRTLQRIYDRTFEQAKLQFYTLGFWAPKDQSLIPTSVRSIEGSLVGKSTALWDPGLKAVEARLLKPDATTRSEILREKEVAVSMARANVEEFARIRGVFRSVDAEDWAERLDLSLRMARVWRAMADAVWTLRVLESRGAASPDERETALAKVAQFEALAETLGGPGPGLPVRQRMVAQAPLLAADVRGRLAAVPERVSWSKMVFGTS